MTKTQLAVVIPAYRGEFLEETLGCLAAQTCRNFQVVVADDASPDDIGRMVARARAQGLDILYKRFDTNVGGSCLVAHWDRAVRLADSPWVMLPGDDDLLDPELVEAFYDNLARTNAELDLYRFNTRIIDGDGALIQVNPTHPEWEGPLAFVRSRLHFSRASFVCEYVFRRAAWERLGGFVDFPLAWCSDDATWAALGSRAGIGTIDGPRAAWRLSGRNISSPDPAKALDKLLASSYYLRWLARNLPNACDWDAAEADKMRVNGAYWLNLQITSSAVFVPIWDGLAMAVAASQFTRYGVLWHLLRIGKHNFDQSLSRVRAPSQRSTGAKESRDQSDA